MVSQIQTCYQHPDRRAGVTCQRCDRPICPSCMTQASVGFHCPECSKASGQKVFTARTVFRSQRPIVTQALVAINVVVFLGGLVKAHAGLLSDVSPYAPDYGMLGGLVTRFGQVVPGIGVAE